MQPIQSFPQFSPISVNQCQVVDSITSKFEPYSDFNFVSLFSWDTDSSAGLTLLSNNLVLKIPDYITNEPIISLLGSNDVEESLDQLLMTSAEIKLVPEEVVRQIQKYSQYKISEDRDNYDYVFDLAKLSTLEGPEYRGKRKRLNRIKREIGNELAFTDVTEGITEYKDRVLSIFDEWSNDDSRDPGDVLQERSAITRLLDNADQLPPLFLTLLSRSGIDIGFSINEPSTGIATCHFHKTVLSNSNLDILLTNHTSKLLLKHGATTINWEQDLGIAGLREFKQSYIPQRMLKKYTITKA